MATSSYWKAQITIVETQIGETNELILIGVKKGDNGKDKLELDNRMKGLKEHLIWLDGKYEEGKYDEGLSDGGCFVGKRETGL